MRGTDAAFDVVIRGGQIVDGTGSAPFQGDVALRDGVIAQVGQISGRGVEEIDARSRIVTPGFVDVHTHYDGQATWDERMQPSSLHGVTTVVMGNCGVGFAPCRPEDHERLIRLMEGVEDIPLPVLNEGLPWTWEHFPEYLKSLEARRFDVDIGAQLPHAALRVYVMGERGANRDPPHERWSAHADVERERSGAHRHRARARSS
jgi:N-acyl-D-aspartate/D-glutamate deacylase